jgi:hypothetical protein
MYVAVVIVHFGLTRSRDSDKYFAGIATPQLLNAKTVSRNPIRNCLLV